MLYNFSHFWTVKSLSLRSQDSITVLLPFTTVEFELPLISQHSLLQALPGYFPWSHEKAFQYTNVVFPTFLLLNLGSRKSPDPPSCMAFNPWVILIFNLKLYCCVIQSLLIKDSPLICVMPNSGIHICNEVHHSSLPLTIRKLCDQHLCSLGVSESQRAQ